jgi:integrase
MAYIRTHDTKQTSRGKVVKRYEVVYRAKVRERGQAATRLRQETYTTREAAEARRDELNSHRHHAHATDPSEQRRRGARSLDDYATDWIAAQRIKVASGNLKERTLDEYGKLFYRYVSPGLGHLPIAAITPAQLEQLIADLATGARRRGGGDLNPKTVKHAWHVTRQVFAYGMRHDALVSNPVDRVDFSGNRATGDRERFAPHPLTAEQIAELSAALAGNRPGPDGKPLPAYPVYALMVEFMAYTGLRASEVAGLEIRDLSFAPVPAGSPMKCMVRIERTKARRGGEWLTGTPKSARSRRTVPLPGWLAAKMADYLAHHHPKASEPTAPLWPGRTNAGGHRDGRSAGRGARRPTVFDFSEPIDLSTFSRRIFAPALAAVGLPVTTQAKDGSAAIQGVRLHDLRHSAAVAWLTAGVQVAQVSRWLGHAQPTITLNVYGDWVPDSFDNPLPEPQARNVVAPLHG